MNKGNLLLFCTSLIGQNILPSSNQTKTVLPEEMIESMHRINEELFKFHSIVYSQNASIDIETGKLILNRLANSNYENNQHWFPLLKITGPEKHQRRLISFVQHISEIEKSINKALKTFLRECIELSNEQLIEWLAMWQAWNETKNHPAMFKGHINPHNLFTYLKRLSITNKDGAFLPFEISYNTHKNHITETINLAKVSERCHNLIEEFAEEAKHENTRKRSWNLDQDDQEWPENKYRKTEKQEDQDEKMTT